MSADPLPSPPHQDSAEEQGDGAADGTFASLAARLDRIERQNVALIAQQAALVEKLARMEAHAHLVGHMVEQMRPGTRHPMALPLPLARLRDLVTDPGSSLAFLKEMGQLGIATATEPTRDAAGAWKPRIRSGRAAVNVARDLSALMFGRRQVVYRVRPHHPPMAVRPRVLHIIPNVFVGGSTQLVVDLLERLGHRYEMQVVTAALPDGGRHEGMVIHHLPLGTASPAFAALLAQVRPALVHVHYWGYGDRAWYEAALAAAREGDAAIIENVNTPVEPLRDPRIARYVFVSRYIRDAFAPDIANGTVIHPGIDLDRFAPRTFAPDAMDTIGMVYRLARDKLDDASLDALIEVTRHRPRTRVVVVGDGELLPVFLARTEAAGVRGNFHFTGAVTFDSLPEIYSRFRIFVAPVVRESFGQVTPFAMAMGQAVAGLRTGALPEILGTDETLGKDNAALADILIGLLETPARIEALGAANRMRAVRFGLDDMIAAYRDVYADALGESRDLMPGFPPATLYCEV